MRLPHIRLAVRHLKVFRWTMLTRVSPTVLIRFLGLISPGITLILDYC
jgi:hypothetical protein